MWAGLVPTQDPPSSSEVMSNSPEIDSSLLDGDIDIDLQAQKRILELVARLDVEDHYALLGVAKTADKAEIKRSYFELMNLYHADRFFGKKIGKYGPLLLRITDVLTRASETLSRSKTREEYDAYLESRQRTLGARLSITPSVSDSTRPSVPTDLFNPERVTGRPPVAPIDVVGPIPRAPRTPEIDLDEPASNPISSNPPQVGSDPPRTSDPPSGGPPISSSRPEPSARGPNVPASDAARKLLARKMGLRIKSPTPQSDPDQVRQAVRADLRARYDAKKNEGEDRVRQLLSKSQTSRQAGDWSAAVAALRMALDLKPDDPHLQRDLNSLQEEADRALAPRFLEQAKYEEKEGQFARAARSYERAARGKDSAQLFNKAAECLLHLEILNPGEKRMVVELARAAVTRDLHRVAYRLTLAQAYGAAGMKTSALGEVQRALELEPENQQARLLQKSLK